MHASAFMPCRKEELVARTGPVAQLAAIEAAVACHGGRLPNLSALTACHPTCLEAFTATHSALFEGPGPLPKPWRYFIAVMAAARGRSTALLEEYVALFSAAGGDPSWVRGARGLQRRWVATEGISPGELGGEPWANVPSKLRALGRINAILCHRPWELKEEHIAELTMRKGAAQRAADAAAAASQSSQHGKASGGSSAGGREQSGGSAGSLHSGGSVSAD